MNMLVNDKKIILLKKFYLNIIKIRAINYHMESTNRIHWNKFDWAKYLYTDAKIINEGTDKEEIIFVDRIYKLNSINKRYVIALEDVNRVSKLSEDEYVSEIINLANIKWDNIINRIQSLIKKLEFNNEMINIDTISNNDKINLIVSSYEKSIEVFILFLDGEFYKEHYEYCINNKTIDYYE